MAGKPAILVCFGLCQVTERLLLWGGICLFGDGSREEMGGKAGETGSEEGLIVRVLSYYSLPGGESSSIRLSGYCGINHVTHMSPWESPMASR